MTKKDLFEFINTIFDDLYLYKERKDTPNLIKELIIKITPFILKHENIQDEISKKCINYFDEFDKPGELSILYSYVFDNLPVYKRKYIISELKEGYKIKREIANMLISNNRIPEEYRLHTDIVTDIINNVILKTAHISR